MELSEILDRQGRLLIEAARKAPDATVPTAPEWTNTDVVRHLAFLHSRVAAALRSGDRENPFRRDDALPPPPKREAALETFDDNLAGAVAAVRDTDPSQPMATFTGAMETAAWWARRMAHETTVHRFDVEQAAGVAPTPIDAAFAADGIDEMLAIAGGVAAGEASVEGPTAHLHTTDVDGEWLVTLGDQQFVVEHGHAKGDVAVRGPAADLYLWIWGRFPLADLETFGNEAVAEQLRDRVRR